MAMEKVWRAMERKTAAAASRRGRHILRACLVLASSVAAAYTNYPAPDRSSTGHYSLHWPSAGPAVPVTSEIQLLRSGALVRRGEFGPLVGSRKLEVELECSESGLTIDQAQSIRKQLLIRKAQKASRRLKNERVLKHISRKFEQQQTPLLDLAQQHDCPPISLFRAIVGQRVLQSHPRLRCLRTKRPAGRIVQSIINESNEDHLSNFLSAWEHNELQIAKEHDIVGYRNNCTSGQDWEQTIYSFLDEHGIEYLSEEEMKLSGMEITAGTPDCLLVDELSINGKEISWIEFKSSYASGLRDTAHFSTALSKQVKRYEAEFGPKGAVILKHGFSEKLSRKYPSTLFLDGGPLHPPGSELHL